jgi:phospholipid/cholesterol/gamma-HCH transport system permease protein
MERTEPRLAADRDKGLLRIGISGEWRTGNRLPESDAVEGHLVAGDGVERIAFDTTALAGWDSGLLTFLLKVFDRCSAAGVTVEKTGLPPGVVRLLDLATAVPERKGARREAKRDPFLARVGAAAEKAWKSNRDAITFVGDVTMAVLRMFRGKARFRRSDLLEIIQECGAQALPIVSLISVLVGLILAFVGAIQLKAFGAQLYVADLVGIAMVREMAAIMTGIIVAGRTGAAFAAKLGTMQVNEEIDALKTMGFSPTEFLVLPRMVALFLMMPLLCLYADLMGVLGGMIVGVTMLDLGVMQYYLQTKAAVDLNNLWIGLVMSAVFGVLVAFSGCLRGIQCGRSASAVGEATTSAVVTGIVSIIVATAVINVICNVLGI